MKKLRALKYLNFLLYLTFSLVVPIILISERYDLYITDVKFYVLIGGSLSVLLVLRFIWYNFKRAISYMENGTAKSICEEAVRLLPYVLVLGILYVFEKQISNLLYIAKWSLISNAIASVFSVYYIKYMLEIRRVKRENNIKQS